MKKLTNIEFINKIDNNLKVITPYTNAHNKVIVEDLLGIQYKVFALSLLQGVKPTIMTAINKNDCFIKRANLKHNNRYNYKLINYKNNSTKIDIICNIHGVFKQTPNIHLLGSGCRQCVKKPGGYNKTNWIEQFNKSKTKDIYKVYIIRIFNNEENYYKVGRTFNKIKKRFNGTIPYNYEILKIITSNNGSEIYSLEKKLHKKLKNYKIKPVLRFKGDTECFIINKITNKILEL